MSINRIFGLSPINRTAALVVSQRGVAQQDLPMGTDELCGLLKIMERKSRLLKRVLSISTKAQHKNATYRFKHGKSSNFRDSRALAEYARLGDQIQVFTRTLAEINAAARVKPENVAYRQLQDQLAEARDIEGVEKPLRANVIRRDGYRCVLCGGGLNGLLVTHITPVDQGGLSEAGNLEAVCLPCWILKNKKEVKA